MTSNPIRISSEYSIFEVVSFFLQNHITSAPIVDSKDKVLGQISDIELMKAFVQIKMNETSEYKIIDFEKNFFRPQFVNLNSTLPEIVTAMLHCPLKRVLVRDGFGLVGIISPKDVLRTLSGQKSGSLITKLIELEAKTENLNQNFHKVEKGLEKYKSLFDESPYMMYTTDQSGVIVLANSSLHNFLEYAPNQLVGKTVFDIHPESLHELVLKSVNQLLSHTKKETTFSSFKTKSGKIHRVELISSCLKDEQGRSVGAVTLSRLVDGDNLLRALNGVLKN